MPRKTKKTKSAARHEMIDTKTEDLVPTPLSFSADTAAPARRRWPWLLVLLVLILGIYAASRGYVVPAVVNGKPIFGWNFVRVLVSRFGQQTLESMVSEVLIADAAKKEGIALTQADIDAKVAEIVGSLGANVKLEDLLKYQGMTKSDFESQIRMQLTVEKILGKQVTVEEKDIDEFIQSNRQTMTATDEASLRAEAKKALFSQKVSEKIQPWFADIRQKANVMRLLK